MIKRFMSFVLAANMVLASTFIGPISYAEESTQNVNTDHTVEEIIELPRTLSLEEKEAIKPKIYRVIDRREHPEELIEEVEVKGLYYNVNLDKDLQKHIISLCEENGIDPSIIIAMAWVESGHRVNAIGDSGNSLGLLQIMPRWNYDRMKRLECNDLLDPYQNITVGVDILTEKLNRFGDISMALMAYNAGDAGANKHWFSKGIYTNKYSQKVMNYAATLERNVEL